MRSWNSPEVPRLPGHGPVPRIYNTPHGQIEPLHVQSQAQIYVRGITPYDATHLGHAATYLAYDTLNRVLRDARLTVTYVQNVTDVDDPLLERANATGVNWQDLAESQIELFRGDMEALGIIPPEHYVGVVESVQEIGAACARLLESGFAYWVDTPHGAPDLYFDLAEAERLSTWHLGQESALDRATMLQLSAERGGDPDREGKRDALDPLLWRSEREGEPAWDSSIGRGRPGWHIECSVIGGHYLSAPITLNGGGSDLIFPHHEMSAAHSAALTGVDWSRTYSHAGMLALDGEKMSKSKGNLVFVSRMMADGADPRAIRLALLAHHYRTDWEWTPDALSGAQDRLEKWLNWASSAGGSGDGVGSGGGDGGSSGGSDGDAQATELVDSLRIHLSHDLDTPSALHEIDRAIAERKMPGLPEIFAIQALLGISLSPSAG